MLKFKKKEKFFVENNRLNLGILMGFFVIDYFTLTRLSLFSGKKSETRYLFISPAYRQFLQFALGTNAKTRS